MSVEVTTITDGLAFNVNIKFGLEEHRMEILEAVFHVAPRLAAEKFLADHATELAAGIELTKIIEIVTAEVIRQVTAKLTEEK